MIVVASAGLAFSCFAQSERAAAEATEIKILSAVVMKGALDDLAREFERTTGHKVSLVMHPRVEFGTAFKAARHSIWSFCRAP
jgi:ABC-type molybdate transport system substrate-binding protein